jgi:hypothetical protein
VPRKLFTPALNAIEIRLPTDLGEGYRRIISCADDADAYAFRIGYERISRHKIFSLDFEEFSHTAKELGLCRYRGLPNLADEVAHCIEEHLLHPGAKLYRLKEWPSNLHRPSLTPFQRWQLVANNDITELASYATLRLPKVLTRDEPFHVLAPSLIPYFIRNRTDGHCYLTLDESIPTGGSTHPPDQAK